jgi:hypothetical protein
MPLNPIGFDTVKVITSLSQKKKKTNRERERERLG